MSGMSRDQTLAPGETPVILVHPHWKVLVKPVALAVLIVAVVLVARVMIPFGKAGAIAALVLGGVAIVGADVVADDPAAALADDHLRADQPAAADARGDHRAVRQGHPVVAGH